MIISYVSLKGGVGKTTLSLATAVQLAALGHKTLLIDADVQGSANLWAKLRGDLGRDMPFSLIQMTRDRMSKDILAVAADYAHVVIDVGGRAEATARSCIAASDIALVPLEPSVMAVEAAKDTTDQIAAALEYRPDLLAAYVVNKVHANARINRFSDTADWLNILDTRIRSRVVHAEACSTGETLQEREPRSPAIAEIEALVKEIINA